VVSPGISVFISQSSANIHLTAPEYKRAIELKPSCPAAHQWYAWYLHGLGRNDESLAQINQAEKNDPLSVWISSNVGFALYFARKYDWIQCVSSISARFGRRKKWTPPEPPAMKIKVKVRGV
jgi:tetratricopeptide (TPR) repeat protein